MTKLKPTKISTGTMYRALKFVVITKNFHLNFEDRLARREKDILDLLKSNGYMIAGFVPTYIRLNSKKVIVIEGKLKNLDKEIHVTHDNSDFFD